MNSLFISFFILIFLVLILHALVLSIHDPYIFVTLCPHPEALQSFLSFMDQCTDVLGCVVILLLPQGHLTKVCNDTEWLLWSFLLESRQKEVREVRGKVNINQVCANKHDECQFPKYSAFCQIYILGERAVWCE